MVSRIACVRAPNPSAMTLDGTNSYLIFGDGEAICIDPGPPIAAHVDRLVREAAAGNARIAAICVTHGHPDHAPAARPLAEATGAVVHAYASGMRDGETAAVRGASVTAYEAPGHTADSLVFYETEERALFTGDVVLGTGTVVIAPPGGDMRAYQATLARLRERFGDALRLYGGHGPPVFEARAKLDEYLEHRRVREAEIIAQLKTHECTIPQIVRHVYARVDAMLWPAAARQVLAYLQALEHEGRVRSRETGAPTTQQDAAMLDPDWSTLAGANDARVIEAELGASMTLGAARVYSLT